MITMEDQDPLVLIQEQGHRGVNPPVLVPQVIVLRDLQDLVALPIVHLVVLHLLLRDTVAIVDPLLERAILHQVEVPHLERVGSLLLQTLHKIGNLNLPSRDRW